MYRYVSLPEVMSMPLADVLIASRVTKGSVSVVLKPKSQILMFPSASKSKSNGQNRSRQVNSADGVPSRMLDGFKSRCTILIEAR